MKRMHVHVSVADLQKNIDFYSRLFGQPPVRRESDYAKWMFDDPRLNFAISNRRSATGINHLGIQVDSDEELAELRERAEAADASKFTDQGETTCCYARSEKHWTVDPQGVAWEHFRTMANARHYGSDDRENQACCRPSGQSQEATGGC